MQSPNEILNQDYLDFCAGFTLDFSLLDNNKAQLLFKGIEDDCTFSDLVEPFSGDLDQLAYCAAFGFSIGKLSRNQVACFLEYRSMKKDFLNVQVINLNKKALANYPNYYFGEILPSFNDNDKAEFHKLIKPLAQFEACVFLVELPESHTKDPRMSEFLTLADALKIIKKSLIPMIKHREFEKELGEFHTLNHALTMHVGSASVREALVKATYYEHAKNSYPRVGVFSIDAIGESIENNGRFIAVDYPSIPCSKAFHKIESKAIYLTLHDELHRRFISTIPNPVYTAFIDAIHLVREKTGITWSREIWDAMDMEVGAFLDMPINYHNYDATNIENNTHWFTVLLNATVYTEGRTAGLFTATPYMDTTWLLLIDMVLDSEKWKKKGIDLSTLPNSNPYYPLCHFIANNKDKISALESSAHQVAVLKLAWFGKKMDLTTEKVQFVKDNEPKQPRYLQIKVNNEPLIKSKQNMLTLRSQILALRDKIGAFLLIDNQFGISALDFISYDPYVFKQIFPTIKTDLRELLRHCALSTAKDRLIKSIVYFEINSREAFLEVLNQIDLRDKKAFLSLLLDDITMLHSNSSELVMMDSTLCQRLNFNTLTLEAIAMLFQAKLLDTNTLELLLINDAHAKDLAEDLITLVQNNLLSNETWQLLFSDADNAYVLAKSMCFRQAICKELQEYQNDANSARFFNTTSNPTSKESAEKLRRFIMGEVSVEFLAFDVKVLLEKGSFLAGIVARCKDNHLILPKALEEELLVPTIK